MKISILVRDLSGNCYGRAHVLAKALSRVYDVEIVGPVGPAGIWMPFDTGEFETKTVPARALPFLARSLHDLLSKITGDVLYALKPHVCSFGLALLKKVRSKLPIVLDIDDWELGLYRSQPNLLLNSLASLPYPDAYPYAALLDRITGRADEITTVSHFLMERYGRGVIVPHGRDVTWLDPTRYDRDALRQTWGLAGTRVILWLGTPLPYKGVEDLVDAVDLLRRDDVRLLMVGVNPSSQMARRLEDRGLDRVILVGPRPFAQLPEFLALSDVVVLPQRLSPATVGQVPAKLFDAMAMAKPIVATRVSDIPIILDGCGLIVEPGDTEALAGAIASVLDDQAGATEMGRRARGRCVREYSIEAMERPLRQVFDRFV